MVRLKSVTCWFSAALVRHRTRLHRVMSLALLVLARPNDCQDLASYVPIALGVALRVWALAYLEKDQVLCVRGPYRYTRNPLYLANLLIAAGLVILANSWIATALSAGLFTLVYAATIRSEERRLTELFGEGYREYCRVTPRLIPWPGRAAPRPEASQPVCWRRVPLRRSLVAQTAAVALLLVAVEAKEEIQEARGERPPVTFGVARSDLRGEPPDAKLLARIPRQAPLSLARGTDAIDR